MTKKEILISFFIIIFFSYNLLAKENIKIIVKIDNELITNYDIKNKIISTLILSKKEINQDNINNLKKISLDSLIQNTIKKIELEKYNIKKDIRRIDTYLNSISSNNKEKLKILFENNNLDFKAFENEIDTEFRWQNLIYQKYSNKIDIDQTNLDQEIRNIIKNQKQQLRYNLSEIEIDSTGTEVDKKKIEEIKLEIKNSSFENAVIKYSISPSANNKGILGWVNSNSLSEEYLKTLGEMQINQVSHPLRKQNKIIFLKLNAKERVEFKEENFDKIKKEIIERKKNELFNLYSSSYLSKLKNSSIIKYFND